MSCNTVRNSYLRMVQSTKDSGKVTTGMDMENRSGQTEPSTRATGKTIKLTVRVNFGMLMVTSLTANGKTIKLMDMVCILTLMELNMLVSGRTTCNTVKELKTGQTVLAMMDNTRKVSSMVTESISGQMDPCSKVIGSIIKSVEE